MGRIVVKKEYRGYGIGKLLMEKLNEKAIELGKQTVIINA